MNKIRIFCAIVLMSAMSLSSIFAQTQKQSGTQSSVIKPAAGGSSTPVTGSGISGQITRWAGNNSSSAVLADSSITEDKFGKIGIGTTSPSSKLTVAGMIESTADGFKFPDGTVQTTAGIALVTHDSTLKGNGTVASPLGIANGGVGTIQLANNAVTAAKIAPGQTVKSFNGLTDQVLIQAGANIALTTVGNTLTIASTVSDPATTAFHGNVNINFGDGQGLGNGTLVIPDGKRLVIEFVSITSSIPEDQELVDVLLTTSINGVSTDYRIAVPATGSEASPFRFAVDKLVRIYADSGPNVIGVASRTPGDGAGNVVIRVSGYLVNIP